MTYTTLTANELTRAIIHARNRRDAYAPGREPASVTADLAALLAESATRRASNPTERAWKEPTDD